MQLQITEHAHNHMTWNGRTPLFKLLIGVLAGWGILVAVLLIASGPQAMRVALVVSGVALLLALALALTTPISDRGELERTLDGGNLTRWRRWLLAGRRVAWEASLEAISGFQIEVVTFEETAGYTYTLARLWAALDDGTFAPLTDWGEVDNIRELGESLAKIGRRVFEV